MKINYSASTPNGKWRWRDPVTGSYISNFSALKLVPAIKGFLSANGRPPMTTEEIEQTVCEQMGLKPPYCESTTATPVMGVTFETITRFFTTAKDWILGGANLAPMVIVNRRAGVCATCPRNVMAGGCSSCDERLGQITAMDGILPKSRVPDAAGKLHNCSQCGCRLNLKVQLPLSSYAGDTSVYPEWCWVTKERAALETSF
jgi:hypothetical protein